MFAGGRSIDSHPVGLFRERDNGKEEGERLEAVIFSGIQGSGKSTFYCERYFDTHVRISLDLLKTRRRERIFLETCLTTEQRFVIDNTNVTVADRATYVAAAKAARFRVACYFFDSPLRAALARNRQRSGRAQIPAPGVISAFKRLERPSLEEGFDELYIVSLDDAGFHVVPEEART
jgi:predicted kinase